MGRIKELECAGAPLSARSLEETCEKGTILAGALLLDLAEQGFGEKAHRWELSGYQHNRNDPWIVLRTVDSTWWDVEGEESDVLETLPCHSPDATPLPEA